MADKKPKSSTSSSFFYILAFIIVVIATFTTIGVLQPFRDYAEHLIPFTAREAIFHGRLFTKEELSKFTGADDGDVYLAILGDVFDVTKGRKHYGVGGGYGFFSGWFGTQELDIIFLFFLGLLLRFCKNRRTDTVLLLK